MSDLAITPADWDWQDFGSGPVLLAQHGRRSVVLSASIGRGGNGESPAPFVCQRHPSGKLVMINPDHPDAKLIRASPNLLRACETALAYVANVNAFSVSEVVAELFKALVRAGYDADPLAISLMGGGSLLERLPQSVVALMTKEPSGDGG